MANVNPTLVFKNNERMTLRMYRNEWNKLAFAIEVARRDGEAEKLLKALVEIRDSLTLSADAYQVGISHGFVNRVGRTAHAQTKKFLQGVMRQDSDLSFFFLAHKDAITNWKLLSGPAIKEIGRIPYTRAV
jgi:hypothetical protein